MVAAMLNRPEEGQVFHHVPEHMTYVPWFSLSEENKDSFFELLNDVVIENRPPKPIGGSYQKFGDEQLGFENVRRFDEASAGFNVISDFSAHAALLGFVRSIDSDIDTTYLGEAWSPHVTGVGLEDLVEFDNLTALRRDNRLGAKVVESVVEWVR
jgi:hypothetical protein